MNIADEFLEIVIERKKIKNVYFRINENKQIYVTCPKYVSEKEILSLLNRNKNSLEKMYKKQEKIQKENEKIYFLGEELDFIQYRKVMFQDHVAYGPSIESVNTYLEKNALPIFQKRVDLWIEDFAELPKFRLRLRKMKSRWGVCNKGSMTVTLNSLLIHKEVDLIDYVIVHELSHFSHMDHSKAFWKCVEVHYPKYKEARKKLRG